ncbi:MAG: hypothetical protein ISR65_08300 [Bacteriovoracaceae bacterium]|nr:hypothetical protein [Bacteriovoracaceae bacterium]
MLTSKKLLVFIILLVAQSASAIYDPTWERPVLSAEEMEISDARYGFENLETASLSLNSRDGEEGMTSIRISLKYLDRDESQDQILKIENVEKVECNATRYTAQLKMNSESQHRMYISLTDYSNSVCAVVHEYLWVAHVNEGYGFCGTMDSRMKLQGNPEAVITIQSL